MKKLLYIITLAVTFITVIPACAYNNLKMISDLVGKTVLFPSYTYYDDKTNSYIEGVTDFPFVYKQECFFTGKNSAKFKIQRSILNTPINIENVTLQNRGKSSEKLCILMSSKDGEKFSMVIPMQVDYLKGDIKIFRELFYHNLVDHPYQNSSYRFNIQNVRCFCYDYKAIKEIEASFVGKKIRRDFIDSNSKTTYLYAGWIFKGFKIVPLHAHSHYIYNWDPLYAVFTSGLEEKKVFIAPLGINHSGPSTSLESWTGYSTFVTLDDLLSYLK